MKYSEIIDYIVQHLLKNLEPYAIVLFGSIINGSFREDSDLDIAFLSDKDKDEYELFIITQQLAGKLGREVDLVDLKKASTVLSAQIIGKGKMIYVKDEKKFAEFRIRALKEYVLLNDERAEILEAIAKRGRVYGG